MSSTSQNNSANKNKKIVLTSGYLVAMFGVINMLLRLTGGYYSQIPQDIILVGLGICLVRLDKVLDLGDEESSMG